MRVGVLRGADRGDLPDLPAGCRGTPDCKVGSLELTGTDPLRHGSGTRFADPLFQRNDEGGVYGPAHHSFFRSPQPHPSRCR